jgi:hypothetical protein
VNKFFFEDLESFRTPEHFMNDHLALGDHKLKTVSNVQVIQQKKRAQNSSAHKLVKNHWHDTK